MNNFNLIERGGDNFYGSCQKAKGRIRGPFNRTLPKKNCLRENSPGLS